MDGFKSTNVTSSKKLKRIRGFRSKVKNLLTVKASKDSLPIHEKLNSSQLGVRRVHVESMKTDEKRTKRNNCMKAQFINDVTSKILQSVDDVPPSQNVSSVARKISEEVNPTEAESGAEISSGATHAGICKYVNSLIEEPVQQYDVQQQTNICISDDLSVTEQIECKEGQTENTGNQMSTSWKRDKAKLRKQRSEETNKCAFGVPIYDTIRKETVESTSSSKVTSREEIWSEESYKIPIGISVCGLVEKETVQSLSSNKTKLRNSSCEERDRSVIGVSIYDFIGKETVQSTSSYEQKPREESKESDVSVYEFIQKEAVHSLSRDRAKLRKERRDEECDKSALGVSIYDCIGKETVQSQCSEILQEEVVPKQSRMRFMADEAPSQVPEAVPSFDVVRNSSIINGLAGHSNSNLSDNEIQKEPIPEALQQETSFPNLEPLIIESDCENAMKGEIVKRLENVSRDRKEDCIATTEFEHSLKKVRFTNSVDESHDTPTCSGYAEESSVNKIDAKTLVTKRFQSLPTEETTNNNVSALRETIRTFSTSHPRLPLVDDAVDGGLEGLYIDFYNLPNDRFFLVLRNGTPVYIRGSVKFSVIAGCAEILGFKFVPEAEPKKYTVFSPRGVSLLSIQPCASDNLFIGNSVMHSLCADTYPCDSLRNSVLMYSEALRDTLEETDCVLLLEKANNRVVEYISWHMPSKLFPSSTALMKAQRKYSFAEKILECEFLPENIDENVKLYCKKDEWDRFSHVLVSQNNINGTNCTLICGGKGVGKSTLLRFLINRSLASHQKVLCLDFDLGQAEFTMPGCISAVIIDEPLLGPNFSHLLRPNRMIFLGDVNVSVCLVQYLKGVQNIVNFCKSQEEFQNIPWFVNTMGFCQGLGFELMMNLLHMISPSHVVQIQSQYNKRNFARYLDAQFVQNYKSSLKAFNCARSDLSYKLHVIPSAAESKRNQQDQEPEWGLDSRTMREIVIMAYLSTFSEPPYFNLTGLAPSVCSFENLQLCVSHETVHPNKILSIMNGNIVGLCVSDEDDALRPSDPTLPCVLLHTPVCCCLGFGIVRGVDISKRQLFLISPLPVNELQRVNCLVMGRVQIPASVLLTSATAGLLGHIPYTVIGPGQPTGRLSQKFPFRMLLASMGQ